MVTSDQLSFYFEKRDFSPNRANLVRKTAIAAVDSVAAFHTQRSQRFTHTKHFIHATLANTLIAGDLTSAGAGPAFFCSFPFEADADSADPIGFSTATVFLPKWQISCHHQDGVVVHNLQIDQDTQLEKLVAETWQTLQQIQSIQSAQVTPPFQPLEFLKKYPVGTTDRFKQSVQSALNSIAAGQLDKVVLAHAVDVISPLPFHQTYSLNNLRRLYPDCYIFAVGNGRGQSFLGASPERLVCLQNRHLLTDALAGSAPRGQTTREDAQLAQALLNSEKDHHEHQVVVDFISRQLERLGLSPELAPLKLLQLSNIQHLHTPIRAIVPAAIHLLDILAALHPTPAVAGLPRDIACQEIGRYEPFARSLYAAPIGWINHRGEGEFVVGIRSALMDGCRARLFAGAGIVAGSDPDRELAEVQLKLQALLNALV
ncbi:MAG: isochorismate synthase [Leptolyngbyaceae cyanobacterium bins.349]|nr:isochorismate synthase [Leptolyngbyaceae cyanobacterium bins.349]